MFVWSDAGFMIAEQSVLIGLEDDQVLLSSSRKAIEQKLERLLLIVTDGLDQAFKSIW